MWICLLEVILNAVWVLLAIGATGFLCLQEARNKARSFSPVPRAHEYLVLACVLILFFPVLSVTDDLQYKPVPEEHSIALAAQHCRGARKGTHARHFGSATTAGIFPQVFGSPLRILGTIFPPSTPPFRRALACRSEGRSPPLVYA